MNIKKPICLIASVLFYLCGNAQDCEAEEFYTQGAPPCTDYISPVKCINLDITESYDFDGLEMEFLWNMGDGQKIEGLQVEHCYEKAGKYQASLTVTDLVTKVVMKDELVVDVYIRGEFSLSFGSLSEVQAGQPFTPVYDLQVPANYEVSEYFWSYGDGRFSCDSLPNITYPAANQYPLVLNVALVNDTDVVYLCAQQIIDAQLPDPTGGSLDEYFSAIEVSSRFLQSPAEYQLIEKNEETYILVKDPAMMQGGKTYNLLVFKGNLLVKSDDFIMTDDASDADRFAAIKMAAESVLEKEQVEFESIRFDLNSSEFSRKMKKTMDSNIELLKRYPFLQVMIGSYTHTGGSYTKNLDISNSRSQQVADYLIEGGIDQSQLVIADPSAQRALINTCVTKGCGYEDENLNRRTDFKVLGVIAASDE